MVHLAQTQSNFVGLGEKAYKKLLKFHSFEKTLLEIADKYTSDKFIACMIPYFCERQNVRLLKELIAKDLLSSSNTRLLCDHAIKGYLNLALDANPSDETKQAYISCFQPLLFSLSQRYVDELDAVLKANLDACSNGDNDARSKALYDFTSLAFKGTRHEVIEEESTTLYLCLISPSASVRLLAVKRLVDALEDTKNPLSQVSNQCVASSHLIGHIYQASDVAESAFTSCLSEWNELLLYAVRDGSKPLLDHVPSQTIVSRLKKLLLNTRGAFDKEESVDILKFLLTDFHTRHPEDHPHICMFLALFVSAASGEHIKKLLSEVSKTSFSKSRLLDAMIAHAKKAIKSSTPGASFLNLEAESTNAGNVSFWMDMLKSDAASERMIGYLVLGRAASVVKGKQQHVFVSQLVDAMMGCMSVREKDDLYEIDLPDAMVSEGNDLLPVILEKLRKAHDISHELSVQLIQLTLLTMTNSVGSIDEEVHWFTDKDAEAVEAYKRSMIALFSIFAGGPRLGICEKMITKLISVHFKDNLLGFLMNVWCSHGNLILQQLTIGSHKHDRLRLLGQGARTADWRHLHLAMCPSKHLDRLSTFASCCHSSVERLRMPCFEFRHCVA